MTPFHARSGTQKTLEVLRWVGVVPVAMLAHWMISFVVGIVGGLAVQTGWLVPGSAGVAYYLYSFLYFVPKQAAFVIAGAKTAPRFQLATTGVLTALGILLSLIVHVLGQRNPGVVNYTHWSLESVGTVAGAVYMVVAETRLRSAKKYEATIE